jgi:hypothetical protein
LIGASTAWAECLKANQNGEVAEGFLSLGTFEDANDRPEKAYILILPAPVCLSGADDIDKVWRADTIHVYSSDEAVAQSLKQLDGKKVKVSRGNRHGEQRDRGRLTSLDQRRSVSLGIRCPRRVSNIESFASLPLFACAIACAASRRQSRFSRSNRLAPWPSDLALPGAGWPSRVPCP